MESLNPEFRALLKPLFHAALLLPPGQRPAFLDKACAGEPPEVRRELERLLAAHDEAGSFIDPAPVFPGVNGRSLDGRDVGRYLIGRLIGVGGMGEVYLARDRELGRDVAFKVALTKDSVAQSRLRREAQHASRLNHPHICTIHEIGSVDGQPFIVMEFVEGPTLADRIARGALPFDEAIAIARQLAEALDTAHTQGIVHRDLKPSNIKLRSDGSIKVLDFGLARSDTRVPEDVTQPLTEPGVAIGTPGYMAPEQLRGSSFDKRIDIWAFGCVTYEMVTGVRAFAGEHAPDTVAAVMTSSPDWSRVPQAWQTLLRRCLERDPARRLRDVGDAMALMAPGHSTSSVPDRGVPRRLALGFAAVLVVATALAAAGSYYFRPSPPPAPQVRFEIQPPEGQTFSHFAFAPSPDGKTVAFVMTAHKDGRQSLWVYSLDSGRSRELIGVGLTESDWPFWSPDSQSIAIYSSGALRTVNVATGATQTICESGNGVASTGAWGPDGTILFVVVKEGGNDGLMRVSDAGGVPVLVTRIDRSRGEIGHGNPYFLPDGRHFFYQRIGANGPTDLYVGSLDAKPEAQPADRIFEVPIPVHYSTSPDPRIGFVAFLRQGKIVAQAFDTRRFVPIGGTVVMPGQPTNEIASREVALSPSTFIYRRVQQPFGLPVWVDRRGHEEPAVGDAVLEAPEFPRLSPDGRRLALVVGQNLWVYDLAGKPPVKLTFDGNASAALWTLDGRRIVYESINKALQSIAADGSEPTPRSASPDRHLHPHAFLPDGRLIAVEFSGPLSSIVEISATGGVSTPLITTPGRVGESGVALSPDGHWLAYVSAATGRSEVWVQPYPGLGAPVRISPNGGVEPTWARSGRELFYMEGPKMMAVGLTTGQDLRAQPPALLFDQSYQHDGQPPSYDVSADGRFLMIKVAAQEDASMATLLNWTGTLLAAIR